MIMTKKCYYKPNRSKKRVFTEKDVARIAKYAKEDGSDGHGLLAAVAVSLGFGWVFCMAAAIVKNYNVILAFVAEAGGILAFAKVVETLLAFLRGGAVIKIPIVNRVAILAIVVLLAVEKIINAVTLIVEEYGDAQEVIDALDAICNKIKELGD